MNPDDDGIVGEGKAYEPIRQAARDLVPLFSPCENAQPWWSLGMLGGVQPSEDGSHLFWLMSQRRQGMGTELKIDLNQLRASAIGLLAYCEKHSITGDSES